MSSFLIQYDRRTGHVEVRQYGGEDGRRQALARRIQAEQDRNSDDLEVVVLTAESLEELQRTHGRYFKTARELLAGEATAAGASTPA